MTRRVLREALRAACFAAVVASCAAPAFGFDPAGKILLLRDLGAGVTPTAINNLNQVAGQGADGVAFRWQPAGWQMGEFTSLGTLGGAESYANDLNDHGVVVGWSHDLEGKKKPTRWDLLPGEIENLEQEFGFEGSVESINNQGYSVGWVSNGLNFARSVRWYTEDAEGQYLFGGTNSKMYGVNDHGHAVGVRLNADLVPTEGFFWDPLTTPASISKEIGSSYFPYAGINNNGLTAGEFAGGPEYYQLGDFGTRSIRALSNNDQYCIANGLNDHNSIVGESDHKGFLFHEPTGELYNANDFQHGGDPFDAIVRLNDINNFNWLVGVGLVDGVEHGFVGQFVLPYADFDGSLTVTGADLPLWKAGFGGPGDYARGDADYNGVVDGADFLAWQQQLGTYFGPAVAVPEPAASLSLAAACAAMCSVRRRVRMR